MVALNSFPQRISETNQIYFRPKKCLSHPLPAFPESDLIHTKVHCFTYLYLFAFHAFCVSVYASANRFCWCRNLLSVIASTIVAAMEHKDYFNNARSIHKWAHSFVGLSRACEPPPLADGVVTRAESGRLGSDRRQHAVGPVYGRPQRRLFRPVLAAPPRLLRLLELGELETDVRVCRER